MENIADDIFIPPVIIAHFIGNNPEVPPTNHLLDGQQRLSSILLFYLGVWPISFEDKPTNVLNKEIDHTRIIPTKVKLAVWKRDRGRCAICGCTKNLHFDHILPFSKGGSSLTEKNIQLLCAKCNLSKHDKII